jgi:hypothetical protein
MEFEMPMIEIDFESFKAITARRSSESVTESDVVRSLLGLGSQNQNSIKSSSGEPTSWESEGVSFPIGTELEHVFRGGRVVKATIVKNGLLVDGNVYAGLSPAGVAVAGYQLNGWRFWYVRNSRGRWVTADSLRG